MSQQELLRTIISVLDAAGVEYMVTGSFVSSLQGEPRASHDIDVVVSLTTRGAEALLAAFRPPDYYLDRFSIESALSSTEAFRQFNLLDVAQGNKVDFWLLSDQPFDQSRFARRYLDDLNGVLAKVSRPEDTILMKLSWAQMSGGSEKQLGDAVRVFEVQFGKLDVEYLDQWVKRLGLQSMWDEVKVRAKVV